MKFFETLKNGLNDIEGVVNLQNCSKLLNMTPLILSDLAKGQKKTIGFELLQKMASAMGYEVDVVFTKAERKFTIDDLNQVFVDEMKNTFITNCGKGMRKPKQAKVIDDTVEQKSIDQLKAEMVPDLTQIFTSSAAVSDIVMDSEVTQAPVSPEQPAVSPEQPAVSPEQPAVSPEQPAVSPATPGGFTIPMFKIPE